MGRVYRYSFHVHIHRGRERHGQQVRNAGRVQVPQCGSTLSPRGIRTSVHAATCRHRICCTPIHVGEYVYTSYRLYADDPRQSWVYVNQLTIHHFYSSACPSLSSCHQPDEVTSSHIPGMYLSRKEAFYPSLRVRIYELSHIPAPMSSKQYYGCRCRIAIIPGCYAVHVAVAIKLLNQVGVILWYGTHQYYSYCPSLEGNTNQKRQRSVCTFPAMYVYDTPSAIYLGG